MFVSFIAKQELNVRRYLTTNGRQLLNHATQYLSRRAVAISNKQDTVGITQWAKLCPMSLGARRDEPFPCRSFLRVVTLNNTDNNIGWQGFAKLLNSPKCMTVIFARKMATGMSDLFPFRKSTGNRFVFENHSSALL